MSARSILLQRLPSRPELFRAYLLCTFPIQAWSLFVFVYKLPSYLLSLTVWQTAGVFAYIQTFTLLESSVIWLSLVGLAAILPESWYRRRFTVQTLMIMLCFSAWAVGVHYRLLAVETESAARWVFSGAGLAILSLAILLAGSVLAAKSEKTAGLLAGIVDRLTVIAGLYLVVAGLAAVYALTRTLIVLLRGGAG